MSEAVGIGLICSFGVYIIGYAVLYGYMISVSFGPGDDAVKSFASMQGWMGEVFCALPIIAACIMPWTVGKGDFGGLGIIYVGWLCVILMGILTLVMVGTFFLGIKIFFQSHESVATKLMSVVQAYIITGFVAHPVIIVASCYAYNWNKKQEQKKFENYQQPPIEVPPPEQDQEAPPARPSVTNSGGTETNVPPPTETSTNDQPDGED
eukprot:TRINITY_DN4470_c0_g1_i1.p1 TRINITY_DN4470_c0_g1~~TRINITY_DN4470_c0_g1_i1.p1  ORF type:complete len:208 (+),score=38.52 TRINITY_DN4470_c0_g1_i1:71-694(+)